jgi:hypothetical protein
MSAPPRHVTEPARWYDLLLFQHHFWTKLLGPERSIYANLDDKASAQLIVGNVRNEFPEIQDRGQTKKGPQRHSKLLGMQAA